LSDIGRFAQMMQKWAKFWPEKTSRGQNQLYLISPKNKQVKYLVFAQVGFEIGSERVMRDEYV
jgi:hypothetical protein